MTWGDIWNDFSHSLTKFGNTINSAVLKPVGNVFQHDIYENALKKGLYEQGIKPIGTEIGHIGKDIGHTFENIGGGFRSAGEGLYNSVLHPIGDLGSDLFQGVSGLAKGFANTPNLLNYALILACVGVVGGLIITIIKK